MKKIRKELLKSTAISIGIAMTIFCVAGSVFDLMYKGNFSLDHYRFTKMVVGCLLTGLGFGVPSVIYENESLPLPIRVVLHMGTGCIVYTIVAFAVGWMGASDTLWQGILIAASQFGIAFLIWFLFMRHYRNEAKEMNERIQAMKK